MVAKFGSRKIESIDRFELQTHVNPLAKVYCQDRVKQDRSYLKSIFDEAIKQEFLVKDPTRTLKIPKNLRPKDKQDLTWEQLRSVLEAASRRDRIPLMLDMTDALCPSELFAFRWKCFDDLNKLSITETIYRRKIRPFGKTPGSMTKVHPSTWFRPHNRALSTGPFVPVMPFAYTQALTWPSHDGHGLPKAKAAEIEEMLV